MKNFSKNLALSLLLLAVLCAPAWAESGKFGGSGYDENGNLKNAATWTLSGGHLTISGGQFGSSSGKSLPDDVRKRWRENATSVTFSGTALAPKDKETKKSFLSNWFSGWSKLQTVDLRGLDTSSLGTLVDMSSMFSSCPRLTSVTFGGKFDTSKVKHMGWLFSECSGLKSLDLSNLNTSSVELMYDMFGNCSSLETVNLNGFNTANVTEMESMFEGCSSLKLLDLRSFNTSKVKHIYYMFKDCSKLETILVDEDGWDMSALEEGFDHNVFKNARSLVGEKGTSFYLPFVEYACIDDPEHGKPGYLSRTPTHEANGWFGGDGTVDEDGNPLRQVHWALLKDGTLTLNGCGYRGRFSGSQWIDYVFHTDEGKPMQSAVSVSFSQTELTVEPGTNSSTLAGMFSGWKKLQKADMSGLTVRLLTDTSAMFYECRALTEVKFGDYFYTSNVKNMSGMFADCDSLSVLDLRGINTLSVTDMSMMFYSCGKLATILVGEKWSTDQVRSAGGMFTGDTVLVGEQGTRYSKSNDDLTYARVDGGTGRPGYLSGKDNSKRFGGVYENGEWRNQARWLMDNSDNLLIYGGQFTRKQWFDYIATDEGKPMKSASSVTFSSTAFASEDGKKETETSLSAMFNAWQNLQAVDMSGLDTMSKGTLTSTATMFSQCSGLTKVKFGGRFNTSKVTNMSMMFYGCSALKTLFLSKLDTSSVEDMHGMFDACLGLRSLNLSTFDTSKVTDMSNMFYKCVCLGALDLSSFNTKNVENMAGMFARCISLTALDISSFDTGYVEKMKEMFYSCDELRTIRVGFGRWTTANVFDSGENMFFGALSLVGGMGTKYDEEHVDKEYARIDDSAVPGYLSESGEFLFEEDRGSSVEPQPVELTEEKVNQVRSAIGSSLPDGVDASKVNVFTFDGEAVDVSSTLRDDSSLSEAAAILPEMSVKQAGVLCFVVSLDVNAPEGATLEWHSFPQTVESGDDEAESVSLAAGGEKTAVFMKDGEVITTVPEDHEVEVAAYLEAGDYAPVIAAVTAPAKHGGSGGGCDAGLSGGLTVLALAVAALKGRR